MGKLRRGGYIFVWCKSDHSPKHVHVYREDMIERRIHGPLLEAATGKLLVKWDLDNAKAMKVTPPGESSSYQEAYRRGSAMKIQSVKVNNKKKGFEVKVSAKSYSFPYIKAKPAPNPKDPIARVFVDKELDREGFSFELASGKTGTVHVDQVLEYNQDPNYLRDLLLYKLTLEAQKRVAASLLAKREIIRRLGTSATQFYRLLDQTNYEKSVDQLVSLLQILDCDVDLVVRAKRA